MEAGGGGSGASRCGEGRSCVGEGGGERDTGEVESSSKTSDRGRRGSTVRETSPLPRNAGLEGLGEGGGAETTRRWDGGEPAGELNGDVEGDNSEAEFSLLVVAVLVVLLYVDWSLPS